MDVRWSARGSPSTLTKVGGEKICGPKTWLPAVSTFFKPQSKNTNDVEDGDIKPRSPSASLLFPPHTGGPLARISDVVAMYSDHRCGVELAIGQNLSQKEAHRLRPLAMKKKIGQRDGQ
jgi:hypothetical protein